ncbi:MAG TPA: pyridoxamine 5'-phosphate oxidase family protein [Ktedonobacteraceae bacterium]
MRVDEGISQGQQEARTRWGTHESGAEFDRKKRTFLTDEAREFIAQQVLCVIVGPGPEGGPRALLLAGQPGFVETPDASTCLIPIDRRYEVTSCIQEIRAQLAGDGVPHVALCFMQHVTRQRLCVQGEVEILPVRSPNGVLWLRIRVNMAFFHCAKYIRTRVRGLHLPEEREPCQLPDQVRDGLTADVRAFLARQVLCYLCTIDLYGQPAVNHRGGAAGFLVTMEPDRLTPGGVVLLPDYAGNGAFEAIGNILETGKATLLVPSYAEQIALCVVGEAVVLEPAHLPAFLRERCRGAQRVIATTVQHVERHNGDWTAALAYEQTRAHMFAEARQAAQSCPL